MANIVENIVFKTTGLDSLSAAKSRLEDTAKAAGAISVAFTAAAAAGVAAMSQFTAAYEVQAQAEIQLEQRIKSTGAAAGLTSTELKNMASSLQSVTTFGDEAIISGQSLLLTFTNIGKDVFPAATKTILDMSTALGQDMRTSAVQLGKALNDPVEGLTALQRVGIRFDDDQKKLIETMVQFGDVAGAQNLILEEMEKRFGGAAEAAALTFGGRMTQINNILGDMQETLGKAIADLFLPIAEWFLSVLPGIQAFLANNAELIVGLGITATGVSAVTAAVFGLTAAVAALGASWASLSAGFATATAFITATMIPALVAVAPYVIAIGVAVAGVIAYWDELSLVVSAVVNGIYLLIQPLVEFIQDIWGGAMEYINSLWQLMGPYAKAAADAINLALSPIISVINGVKEGASGLVETMKVLAGQDLAEDIRGDRMLNRTSGSSGSSPVAKTPVSTTLAGLERANTSLGALDAWSQTTDGSRFIKNNPDAFKQMQWKATLEDRGIAQDPSGTTVMTSDYALVQAWQGVVPHIKIDPASVQELASATSNNGATYQRTRYAY